ncbi:kinase-like domain-containing protein [Rhizophagus diaphanus]|nr:kinase-like domain-containing protein [Rhizophagus diaphanus] [Rhizophagus sp. MUCL 43196]
MGEVKLSNEVIEQIRGFNHWNLTKEQETLIDKVITDKNLKERFKEDGLCKECKQPNANSFLIRNYWCQSCNAKHFEQNFKNWTSGNKNVDEFIQKTQLNAKNHYEVIEWIDYNKFENVENLTKGGFGTVYRANWKDGYICGWNSENNQWERYKYNYEDFLVALKSLNNSQDISPEFLKEIQSNTTINSYNVIHCYGITKDPESNNFMMVTEYAKNGNLRQHLNKNFTSLKWKEKLHILHNIAYGLCDIHNNKSIHHNFHCGNIFNSGITIADIGVYQPANVKPPQNDNDKKVYGVLPYVAPEVLRKKEYTQASDIYGFGIIAYEVCTGLPPCHDVAHDEALAVAICQGSRPKSNYTIPQLISNLIKQCWDADHSKRPNANALKELLMKLYDDTRYNSNSLIYKQIIETNEANKQLYSSMKTSLSSTGVLSYKIHPQAVYTSRLLDFKNLPEPKNAADDLKLKTI